MSNMRFSCMSLVIKMEYLQIFRKPDGSYIATNGDESSESNNFESLVYGVLRIIHTEKYKKSSFELVLRGKLVDRSQIDTLVQQEKEADFTLGQQGILEMIVKLQNKVGSIAGILGD